jgi:hypothetical protein
MESTKKLKKNHNKNSITKKKSKTLWIINVIYGAKSVSD